MNFFKFVDRFLKEVMMSVKFGGIVYYYGFGLEEDLFFEYE